jgi:hypothetical protein
MFKIGILQRMKKYFINQKNKTKQKKNMKRNQNLTKIKQRVNKENMKNIDMKRNQNLTKIKQRGK